MQPQRYVRAALKTLTLRFADLKGRKETKREREGETEANRERERLFYRWSDDLNVRW